MFMRGLLRRCPNVNEEGNSTIIDRRRGGVNSRPWRVRIDLALRPAGGSAAGPVPARLASAQRRFVAARWRCIAGAWEADAVRASRIRATGPRASKRAATSRRAALRGLTLGNATAASGWGRDEFDGTRRSPGGALSAPSSSLAVAAAGGFFAVGLAGSKRRGAPPRRRTARGRARVRRRPTWRTSQATPMSRWLPVSGTLHADPPGDRQGEGRRATCARCTVREGDPVQRRPAARA